jgi:glycosyltransferase involved in cell wall biosynthesis
MIQQPLLPHIGVIALVPDPWAATWQPRHYVLARLAQYFYVVWITPAPDWRGMFRVLASQKAHDIDPLRPPGLIVYEPEVWLPNFYRAKSIGNFTFSTRLKRARRLLTARGCRKIILYLWRPEFAQSIDCIPHDLSCYHIDDDYSFSEIEVPPDQAEMSLMVKVGQVFIHSPGLMEKKGAINPHTAFIPNGVDFATYANPAPEPTDLSVIRRPRILYTGYIKKQLDWRLLLDLARRHSEWSFVFVGPISPHPEIMATIQEISSCRNVYFLGTKTAWALGAYPQHCDACIMPYRVDAYTNNIYPLKLHEYLASGRPVVGSPIRSLKAFTGAVALAKGVDGWSHALACALESGAICSEAVAARRQIACEHDWGKVVHAIARNVCDRLGPEYAEQFARLNLPGSNHSLSVGMSDN